METDFNSAEKGAANVFFNGDVLAMRAYYKPLNRAKREIETARTLRRCENGRDLAFAGTGKGFWQAYFKMMERAAYWRKQALQGDLS